MTDSTSDSRDESTDVLPAEPAADATEDTTVDASSAEPTNEEPAESAGDAADALTEDDLPISRAERRIRKLVAEKKEAKAESQELRERLEQLEAAEEPEVTETGPEPDQRQQARKMIETDAKAYLERTLGMPLEQVKARLAATERTDHDYAERQWTQLCEGAGLDPKSEHLQAYVGGMAKMGNVPIEKAVEHAKEFFAGKKSTPTASVETNGNTGVMAKDDKIFWDKASANEAAQKGIRAKHAPIDAILRESLDKENRQGR